MKVIFLVQPDEADTARRMERTLLSLPEEAGILFAGVSVIPDPLSSGARRVLYRVVVGCSRSRDLELVSLMARTYLRQEIKDESELTVEVHRGLDRRVLGT